MGQCLGARAGAIDVLGIRAGIAYTRKCVLYAFEMFVAHVRNELWRLDAFVDRLYDERRTLQEDSREARKELREIGFWDAAPSNQVRKSGRGRGRREGIEQELREKGFFREGGGMRSRYRGFFRRKCAAV